MRLLSEAAYVLRTRLESSLQSSHRDRPLLAIGLVLASTVFLSCSDVTAKYLASSVPAIDIAWLRYLVFLLIVLPPLLRTGARRVFASQRPGLQVFRGFALVISSILFISSLRFLPIAARSTSEPPSSRARRRRAGLRPARDLGDHCDRSALVALIVASVVPFGL